MSDMPLCNKAIIAVAGFGTRRLPATKSIEKCMIPVGNRPIVDYAVQECIKAGITDIIIVVGEQSEQIRTYYGHNDMLEAYLEREGKTKLLEEVVSLSTKARIRFVIQDRNQPYGTSTPVWLSKDLIGPTEPFLFLYGDNIFHNADGGSAIADFLNQAAIAGADGAMLAVEVPPDQVSRYGIIALEQRDNREVYQKIVEKPAIGEAPSNLNNAGCFLLWPDIMPYVERTMKDSPQTERYIIDALNWYADDGHDVAVVRIKGEWLDCGTVEGWLYANNRILGPASV